MHAPAPGVDKNLVDCASHAHPATARAQWVLGGVEQSVQSLLAEADDLGAQLVQRTLCL